MTATRIAPLLAFAALVIGAACSEPAAAPEPVTNTGPSTPSPGPTPSSSTSGQLPDLDLPSSAPPSGVPDGGPSNDAGASTDAGPSLDSGSPADASPPLGHCNVAADCDGQGLPHPDCVGHFVCGKDNMCVWVCGGTDPPQEQCGPGTCAVGEVCCNPSCGVCTKPGDACTQQICGVDR